MTLRTVLIAGAAVALLASAGCHKKAAPDAASDAAMSTAAASDAAMSTTAASDAAMAPASK
jgi:hypothetical protein